MAVAVLDSPFENAVVGYTPRENAVNPAFKQVTDYCGSGSGIYRISKVFSDIFKFLSMTTSSQEYWSSQSRGFADITYKLSVFRVPDAIGKLKSSIFGSPLAGASSLTREAQKRVYDVLDSVSVVLYAVRNFVQNTLLGRVSDVLSFAAAIPDCSMAVQDVCDAKRFVDGLDDNASEGVKENAGQTLNLAIVKLAKVALGMIAATLGLLSLTLASPVALGLSMITSAVSLGAYFYEKNLTYTPIDFYAFA